MFVFQNVKIFVFKWFLFLLENKRIEVNILDNESECAGSYVTVQCVKFVHFCYATALLM